jgi:hypothetical protein
LAEHADGRFEIITWCETADNRPLSEPAIPTDDEEREIAA